jgi:hypothetical protein
MEHCTIYIYTAALTSLIAHRDHRSAVLYVCTRYIIYTRACLRVCACVKYVHIYIRGGYIKRVSFITAASGTEKKWENKKNEKMLVGGRKNAARGGTLYTYICIYKKIYIIRFTNRNGCSVICRAWRKCVESLTRIRRRRRHRRLLVIFVHRWGAYIYMCTTLCVCVCVENGSQLFGTLFSVYTRWWL